MITMPVAEKPFVPPTPRWSPHLSFPSTTWGRPSNFGSSTTVARSSLSDAQAAAHLQVPIRHKQTGFCSHPADQVCIRCS
jgi:hypothetical protein